MMAEAPNRDLTSLTHELEQIAPEKNIEVLKEFVSELTADAKENPSLINRASEAALCLKDIINFCSNVSAHHRVGLPYESLSRFSGFVNNYYSKWKWQDRQCRVILIGETGAGKSSLGNVLLEGRCPEERFKVGHEASSETQHFQEQEGYWLGERKRSKIAVIDTPGTNDTSLPDDERMEVFIKELRKMQYLTAFILVFNSQNPRFTAAHKDAIRAFQGVFNIDMFNNTLVVFTRWAADERSAKKRSKTEEQTADNFTEHLRKELNIENDIPCYFLDCRDYQQHETPEYEVKKHEDTLESMLARMQNLTPYKVIDVDKIIEKEKMIKKLLKEILKNTNEQNVAKEEDKKNVNAFKETFAGCINEEISAKEEMDLNSRLETMMRERRQAERSIAVQKNIKKTKKSVEENCWVEWLLGGFGVVAVALLVVLGIKS